MKNKKLLALCVGVIISAAAITACGDGTGDGNGDGGNADNGYTAEEVISITTATTQYINTEVEIAYELYHGYELSEITVDGETVTSAKYVFTELKNYVLTVSAEKDGVVKSRSETITVSEDEALKPITVALRDGYYINTAVNLSCTVTNGYTLKSVTVGQGGHVDIIALDAIADYAFSENGDYVITYTATKNGSTKTLKKTVTVEEDVKYIPLEKEFAGYYNTKVAVDISLKAEEIKDDYVLCSIAVKDANGTTTVVSESDYSKFAFKRTGNYTVVYTLEKDGTRAVAEVPIRVDMQRYTMIEAEEENEDTTAIGNWSKIGSGDGAALKSSTVGDTYTLKFTGIGFKIFVGTGPGAGKVSVNVDGVDVDTADFYKASGSGNRQLMYSKIDLDQGEHTLILTNVSDVAKRMNINLNAFEIVSLTGYNGETVEVESNTEKFKFRNAEDEETEWTNNGSAMQSKVAGEYVEFEFEGIGFNVYLGTGAGAGRFKVIIDGEEVAIKSAYSTSGNSNSLQFSVDDLSFGRHTVRLVNLGDENGANKNFNFNSVEFIESKN